MSNKDMPAYPVSEYDIKTFGHKTIDETAAFVKGLTKLEAFTLAALQGLCANVSIREGTNQDVKSVGMLAVALAECTLIEIEWKSLHNENEAALAELGGRELNKQGGEV